MIFQALKFQFQNQRWRDSERVHVLLDGLFFFDCEVAVPDVSPVVGVEKGKADSAVEVRQIKLSRNIQVQTVCCGQALVVADFGEK